MAINLSGLSLASDGAGGGGGVTAKMKFIPVTTLPNADEAKKTSVYLVPAKNATSKNKYDEYVVIKTENGYIWELFGQDVSVDLQSFATKTDLAKKQDKLVNQQNIRSINNVPLVGAGNINFEVFATAAEHKKVTDFVDNAPGTYATKEEAIVCLDITSFSQDNFIGERVHSVKIVQGKTEFASRSMNYGGGYIVFDLSPNDEQTIYEVFDSSYRFRGMLLVGIGASHSAYPTGADGMFAVGSDEYNRIYDMVRAAVPSVQIEELGNGITGKLTALESVSRRGTMEVWHAIIDYTKRFEIRATGTTIIARFAVNPYNPKPQHQFVKPSYDVIDGVDVRMTICSDAACTNVIANEGELIEFAPGTFVYVKYDLYYHSSVLGKKVWFAAKDAYGDFVGEKIETLSPVTLFCESDYVSPLNGNIRVHTIGGMLNAAGKRFGSDYRYLSKLTMDGVAPSGGGDLSRVSVGNAFEIFVNASENNLGDTINIRVESAAVDVFVSNEESPAYKEEIETRVTALENKSNLLIKVVSALPAVGDAKENLIYVIASPDGEDGNLYDEYIITNGAWEKVGSRKVNLDGFATEAELAQLDLKVGEIKTLVESYDLDVISSMLDELNGTSDINGQLDELNS